MPANSYRLDIKMSEELKRKMSSLQVELEDKLGKHVPKGVIVCTILELFFERQETLEHQEEEEVTCVSPKKE